MAEEEIFFLLQYFCRTHTWDHNNSQRAEIDNRIQQRLCNGMAMMICVLLFLFYCGIYWAERRWLWSWTEKFFFWKNASRSSYVFDLFVSMKCAKTRVTKNILDMSNHLTVCLLLAIVCRFFVDWRVRVDLQLANGNRQATNARKKPIGRK